MCCVVGGEEVNAMLINSSLYHILRGAPASTSGNKKIQIFSFSRSSGTQIAFLKYNAPMKAVKAAVVRGKVKAPAGKVVKQVVVERGTKGGGEASAEEAPAPTEEEIATFALEARAAAQSAGRPLVVPLPTPNRDLIAPEDVHIDILYFFFFSFSITPEVFLWWMDEMSHFF